jgi:hypothetical protein
VRRAALAASAAALALGSGLAGCGGEARDLFLVQRSGSIPGARLSLRVTDDGRASCNRRPLVDITSAQLIDAREAEEDLEPLAERGVRLPPGPGSILRYSVRLEAGTVRFSDTSPRQPRVFFRVAALTRRIARGPCGLPR